MVKFIRRIAYVLTLINIAFQAVYMICGRFTTTELGSINYIFYIFRPEYMAVSGAVAAAAVIALVICSIMHRKLKAFDAAAIILNIEYTIYYCRLIMIQ